MAQKPPTNLGAVLDNHLQAADVSRRALAARTGIPHTTLLRRFTAGGFTVLELEAIAGILGVKASDLMAEAEQVAA